MYVEEFVFIINTVYFFSHHTQYLRNMIITLAFALKLVFLNKSVPTCTCKTNYTFLQPKYANIPKRF